MKKSIILGIIALLFTFLCGASLWMLTRANGIDEAVVCFIAFMFCGVIGAFTAQCSDAERHKEIRQKQARKAGERFADSKYLVDLQLVYSKNAIGLHTGKPLNSDDNVCMEAAKEFRSMVNSMTDEELSNKVGLL